MDKAASVLFWKENPSKNEIVVTLKTDITMPKIKDVIVFNSKNYTVTDIVGNANGFWGGIIVVQPEE